MVSNYLIVGKRATGKTTLANKLLNGVPNSVILEYEGQDLYIPGDKNIILTCQYPTKRFKIKFDFIILFYSDTPDDLYNHYKQYFESREVFDKSLSGLKKYQGFMIDTRYIIKEDEI